MRNDGTSKPSVHQSPKQLEPNAVSNIHDDLSSQPLVTTNNSALDSGKSVESSAKVPGGSTKQVPPKKGLSNLDKNKIGKTKDGWVRKHVDVEENDTTKPLKWDPEVLDSLVSDRR